MGAIEQVLIAYLKPHNSRRFDIVPIDEIVTYDTSVAYSNDVCFLKNVFPRVDCIILLIDEPGFLSANYHEITDHFLVKGYYNSDRFPSVLYDNSTPKVEIEPSKGAQKVDDLRDCFCRSSCRHGGKQLLRVNKKFMKAIKFNVGPDCDDDDFQLPFAEDEINLLFDDYVYSEANGEMSLAIARKGCSLMLTNVDVVHETNDSMQIIARYYHDKNLLLYMTHSKAGAAIEPAPILPLPKRMRLSPSSDYYSEGSTTPETLLYPCTSTPKEGCKNGKMAPLKKRYLYDLKRFEDAVSSSNDVVNKNNDTATMGTSNVSKQLKKVKIETDESLVAIKKPSRIKMKKSPRESVVSESSDEGYQVIGDSGETKIPLSLYDSIKDKKYTTMTRTLLKNLFTRDTLASSSLTGKMSPAFLNSDKTARKPLDPIIVKDIVKCVSAHHGVPETLVRSVITTKCADEFKMKKMREMKNGKKSM